MDICAHAELAIESAGRIFLETNKPLANHSDPDIIYVRSAESGYKKPISQLPEESIRIILIEEIFWSQFLFFRAGL